MSHMGVYLQQIYTAISRVSTMEMKGCGKYQSPYEFARPLRLAVYYCFKVRVSGTSYAVCFL